MESKSNIRFLPPRLSTVVVYYIWLVIPLVEYLSVRHRAYYLMIHLRLGQPCPLPGTLRSLCCSHRFVVVGLGMQCSCSDDGIVVGACVTGSRGSQSQPQRALARSLLRRCIPVPNGCRG